MASECRCGHTGDGPHPCHGDGYRCRAPARHRLYAARLLSLAGMQPKVGATDTWACDSCWAEFNAERGGSDGR